MPQLNHVQSVVGPPGESACGPLMIFMVREGGIGVFPFTLSRRCAVSRGGGPDRRCERSAYGLGGSRAGLRACRSRSRPRDGAANRRAWVMAAATCHRGAGIFRRSVAERAAPLRSCSVSARWVAPGRLGSGSWSSPMMSWTAWTAWTRTPSAAERAADGVERDAMPRSAAMVRWPVPSADRRTAVVRTSVPQAWRGPSSTAVNSRPRQGRAHGDGSVTGHREPATASRCGQGSTRQSPSAARR